MTVETSSSPRPLIPAAEIAARIAVLGPEIAAVYRGPVTAIAVCNGAMLFAADLVRAMDMPLILDSVRVDSYVGENSTGRVELRLMPKTPLAGRDLLLIDDILDTGRTLAFLRDRLLAERPASLRTCVLCDKPSRRVVPFAADFVGFTIPDRFVVGYGMDGNEFYRNLPYLGVMDGGA